jgi:hypothetical protein
MMRHQAQRGRRHLQRAARNFSTSKTIERTVARRSRQLAKAALLPLACCPGSARRRSDAPNPPGVPVGRGAACLAATGTPSSRAG